MRPLRILAAALLAAFVVGSILAAVFQINSSGPCVDRPCGEPR